MTKQNALNLPFVTPTWTPLTLQGGWQDYGAPYLASSYAIFLKILFLRGVIKGGANGIFAQIPTSLAPSSVLYFKILASDINAYVSIDTSGNLTVYTTNNSYVFLNQIMYLIL
ncbi:MAG TPA: hypothetical protein V6D11_12375 [Waterburya sp.]|jgi:hypothetical protein